MHAGAAEDGELAIVRVNIVRHEGEHPGTTAHGVRTHDWPAYAKSVTIERVEP